MHIEELKKSNSEAYKAFVVLWSELSRVSLSTSIKYLKDGWGTRFSAEVKGPKVIFKDSDQEEEFVYDLKKESFF